MKYLILLLFFFGGIVEGFSQTYSIKGKIQETGSNLGVPNATIILLMASDSTQVNGMISDLEGNFEIASVRQGEYLLKVQYVGYQNFFKTIQVEKDMQLGSIFIREVATDLSEVIISARRSTGTQKSDTTMYNADAFKTMKDASAQTLIEKLPGVNSADGVLQAQGENIAQILVDGKPFFGGDIKTALQNIPAEVIQSIEIFDQKSEKAQLSGFDDGERMKTINIITKPNRRKGQFGKTTAGYGTDDRYLVGASINAFDEDQRITFTGLSNNINLLNYSSDPNAQENSTPQEGIIKTNILGLNYSDLWGEKIKVTGSYVYTNRENVGVVNRFRDFVTTDESNQFYTETSTDVRGNNEHQANLRIEYNIDEKNRILYIPRFSAQFETENSAFFGETEDGVNPINKVENLKTGKYQDYDIFNRLLYSHKFNKPGRTITWRTNFSNGWNEDESDRKARNTYFEDGGERLEILNQRTSRTRQGNSWETGISFTEPLGKKGQMELEYEIGNRKNDSDKLTYNVEGGDFETGNLKLDTALSNTFESQYITQELEFGYQYTAEKFKMQTELQYQDAKLDNKQQFPAPFDLKRQFSSILPTVRMEYKFSPNTNIQVDYDTYTNEPQINQLQNVIDNTNPLQLRTGNPQLDQAYSNSLRLRFRSNNPDTDRNWFLFAQSTLVDNYISNSSFIASEPTEIQDGIILEKGSQLNKPVNLDGFFELRSWASYGMPLGFMKSNFNINAGAGITRRPGLVNDQLGFNNSQRLSTGISINSNISDQIDFNIWSRSSYNKVENTLNPSLNDSFFNQRFRLNFNWIFWEGFVYRLDLNHQINSGLSEGFDNSFSLVNMSLGKKVLKNQRGEISIMVYDLFAQNANVRRNITETFIEDIQTNVLQRYFMLTFTYNIRRFSKGMDEDSYNDLYKSEENQ
ncbi:MAG: outer membrane beta-barrel protein [Algoriphagus sp.]|nr:outer membrane beta-barrel protein [Algoriphagus sp.]